MGVEAQKGVDVVVMPLMKTVVDMIMSQPARADLDNVIGYESGSDEADVLEADLLFCRLWPVLAIKVNGI